MFPLDLSVFNDAILAPFSESVTYVPISSSERSITANVERDQVALVEGAERAVAIQFTVTVRNNETTGISASEIDRGGDGIKIAEAPGGTLVLRKIQFITSVDGGMITFVAR
jgi:hypothetical protein